MNILFRVQVNITKEKAPLNCTNWANLVTLIKDVQACNKYNSGKYIKYPSHTFCSVNPKNTKVSDVWWSVHLLVLNTVDTVDSKSCAIYIKFAIYLDVCF